MFVCKLQVRRKSIQTIQKILKFLFPMRQKKKKMSSVYLSQTKGLKFGVVKKSVSNLSIKIQAYGGAIFVSMATPEICCFIFKLNSKKLLNEFNTLSREARKTSSSNYVQCRVRALK